MVSKQKGKPVELSIFQRIAFSDLDTIRKAQKFLQAHGYIKATDQHDLAAKLGIAVHEGGEAIIPEFLDLHPDIEYFKTKRLPKAELVEQLNACGCAAMLGDDGEITIVPKEEKKIAEPAPKATEPAQQSAVLEKFNPAEHMPLIIISGIICVTIAAITLSKK